MLSLTVFWSQEWLSKSRVGKRALPTSLVWGEVMPDKELAATLSTQWRLYWIPSLVVRSQ